MRLCKNQRIDISPVRIAKRLHQNAQWGANQNHLPRLLEQGLNGNKSIQCMVGDAGDKMRLKMMCCKRKPL
jgi:hypothetical protein